MIIQLMKVINCHEELESYIRFVGVIRFIRDIMVL